VLFLLHLITIRILFLSHQRYSKKPIMKFLYILILAFGFSAKNPAYETALKLLPGIEKSVKKTVNVRDGDVIFQTSPGNLSKAIQLATHSKYSHCGIIFFENGEPYVYEAIQPVTKTLLNEWISRGDGKNYVVKRYIKSDAIGADDLKRMKSSCFSFLGKNYDIYFGWSDERIYCSELVWKVYKNSLDVSIGKLQSLKDFDLSNQLVQQKLREHYGKNIPYNEKVISPQAIFESPLLKDVVMK
jgi:hypothetical protein